MHEVDERDDWFPAPPEDFLFGHRIHIEQICPIATSSADFLHVLTVQGQRAVGLKELRDFTGETEALIIVDPYIFSGENADADRLVMEFKKSARIGGKRMKRVHFVYDPDRVTKKVKTGIKKLLNKEKVKMTEATTKRLHDRVWIADRDRGLVVGTSLSGIGERAAFLLPLPKLDLTALMEYLDENKLSRAQI